MSDHAHATHVPGLQHHFATMEQQKEAGTVGMWVFLVTEIMFFGGLFLAYALFRYKYPEGFEYGSHLLNVTLGGFNTVVLIVSSLTMAMSVYYAQLGKRGLVSFFLIATLLLGMVFLGVKYVEYSEKFKYHLFPALTFYSPPSPETATAEESHHAVPVDLQPKVRVFLWIYFLMTGIHALHMIIGAAVLLVILWMNHKGRFSAEYSAPVEVFGLYWHFVDIIWIFLFPLLYLTGFHLSVH